MKPEVERALRALLIRFGGRVRAEIARRRLDRHGIDAQDIEQEVRIRLWKILERDPNAALPASYIQRVVLSVLVDAIRRADARPAETGSEEEVGFDLIEAATAAPDRAVAAEQMAGQVQRFIAALPERRQRPLQLYLQGFSLAEAAQLCNLSFDSGRKLIYRGLDELRQQLSDAGLEPEDD